MKSMISMDGLASNVGRALRMFLAGPAAARLRPRSPDTVRKETRS